MRKCSWEGTAAGTGKWARKCLSYCLILLMELYGWDANKGEYVQSLCKRLLTWQDWHDLTPARVFLEELCEAVLSRVTVQCELHAENTSAPHPRPFRWTLPPERACTPTVPPYRACKLTLPHHRPYKCTLPQHGAYNPLFAPSQGMQADFACGTSTLG